MDSLKKFRNAVFYLLLVIGIGTLGFFLLEEFSLMDSLYLTIVTIATVGYGDFVPVTAYGKTFAIFLIISGVGLAAYTFGNIINVIVEGHLNNMFGRRKMEKQINKLTDHIIICGAGRVGQQIINQFIASKTPFVAIDNDEEIIENLVQNGVLAIHGDASKDDILIQARIHEAKGLMACLPGDANNVFITLSAKGLNPNIKIVARVDQQESEEKLKRAGAEKVISPTIIGGKRMADLMRKPLSVSFLDTLVNDPDIQIDLEEFHVDKEYSFVNKPLKEAKIKQMTGVLILAISRDKKIIANPSPEEIIRLGDHLVLMGTQEELNKLETMFLLEGK